MSTQLPPRLDALDRAVLQLIEECGSGRVRWLLQQYHEAKADYNESYRVQQGGLAHAHRVIAEQMAKSVHHGTPDSNYELRRQHDARIS